MKRQRSINKIFASALSLLLTLLLLAACAEPTPSIDLSQNNFTEPEQTTEDTTEPEPEDTFDVIPDETEDIFSEDIGFDTEQESTDTEPIETEPPIEIPDVTELTFLYTPNSDLKTCKLNVVLQAPEELEIPETIDGFTVTEITKGAFDFARNVTSLKLPATIKKIGLDVFSLCTNLSSVDVPSLEAWLGIEFESYGSNPVYRARNLFINGEKLEKLEIPQGVETINSFSFYNCASIRNISFPSSLKSIGAYAFYNSRANSVGISSLTHLFNMDFASISSNPLAYARNLYVNGKRITDIVVPDEITKIKPYTFYQFSGITSIDIHKNVTEIGTAAFLGCDNLYAVVIHDVAAWCSINFANEDANPMCSAKSLALNNGISTNELIAVEIPASVKEIAPFAFYNCANIVAITFEQGSQLTSIGASAFRNCLSLGTIYVPDTLTSIGSLAFSMCPSLATLFEYDGAFYLGNFNNPCLALISIVDDDGDTTTGSNITSFTIPNTTKIIYYAAFSYCTKLQSIVIPDSVIFIGNSAFYNCTSLASVTISNNISSIGSSLFSNCSMLEKITIPSNVKEIGRSAFSGCSALTSVTLSAETTLIDQYAFRDCSKLASISIPSKVTFIGSGAFSGCTLLKSVAFASRNGWSVNSLPISASDLQNPSVAAFYLTDDYDIYDWTKK